MNKQIPLEEEDLAPHLENDRHDGTVEIAPDVAYKRLAIVNIMFVGEPGNWVLVDAGLPGTTGIIKRAAEKRFGEDNPPAAIVMTHGHFDHVGALKKLADYWEVPIYAHPLEHPHLNGTSSYPPPDTDVGGGLMAISAPLFPKSPIDVSSWLRELPEDGTVPGMPGWRWIHTPGHTFGHISLWREADRTLIAGDAFVTTRQESAYAVLTQEPEMHGPPRYFTPDWNLARASVETLAALEPELVITGHGAAMSGAHIREALHHLATNFMEIAVPKDKR